MAFKLEDYKGITFELNKELQDLGKEAIKLLDGGATREETIGALSSKGLTKYKLNKITFGTKRAVDNPEKTLVEQADRMIAQRRAAEEASKTKVELVGKDVRPNKMLEVDAVSKLTNAFAMSSVVPVSTNVEVMKPVKTTYNIPANEFASAFSVAFTKAYKELIDLGISIR